MVAVRGRDGWVVLEAKTGYEREEVVGREKGYGIIR